MTALSPPQSSALPARPVLLAFLAFVVVGGGASVAIRITYAELAPFWASTARFGLAALIFWAVAAYKKIPLPKGRALMGAIIFGTLTMGLAFLLIAWALVEIPASLYQILMALVPLLTIFLSTLHGIESVTTRGIVGSLLAVAGIAVAVLFGSTISTDIPILRILGIIVAAACIAEGGVLIKSFPPNPPIMTNGISMTIGALILGTASIVTGESWVIPTAMRTWIAFIYLVLFVTILAFMIYMFVLRNWTASGTSYGFVLIPLVTMVVATTLAGERITVYFLIGAALVLAGVLVGALLPTRSAKAEAIEECKDRSGQVLPRCA